ncbi:hypothetical protein N752_05630 [Desulforamulus aquiferis]|nr:hypothetical protein N752_05630 [Desulforamulus aquiferis]
MGYARPGDMGFDVVHLNLHKTFATPHGGGGPGSGPVGVKRELTEFLPKPLVAEKEGTYYLDYNLPKSIGRVKSFYGNFGVVVKAYSYLRALGGQGLKQVSRYAVLNANYLMKKLSGPLNIPFERTCMHEFVATPPKELREKGIKTLDLAKGLLDYGYHPPTIYFPLIVKRLSWWSPQKLRARKPLIYLLKI